MQNVLEIYSKYRLMPTLQEHQLRVAAAAKQLCDSIPSATLDVEGIIEACLFHDMGNIIKSDLNYFPEFLKPEGLEYWQKVKDNFIEKYGNEEHVATEKICDEIGLPLKSKKYFSAMGFSRAKNTLEKGSIEEKICCYIDQRVGPYGILPLKQRLEDGQKRYQYRKDKALDLARRQEFVAALEKMEEEIFSGSFIKPEDITDSSIKSIMEDLKLYKLSYAQS